MRVFGSVARGEDRPDSDVDLPTDFPPGLSLFGLGRLEADLEGILGARIDLIPPPTSNRESVNESSLT